MSLTDDSKGPNAHLPKSISGRVRHLIISHLFACVPATFAFLGFSEMNNLIEFGLPGNEMREQSQVAMYAAGSLVLSLMTISLIAFGWIEACHKTTGKSQALPESREQANS